MSSVTRPSPSAGWSRSDGLRNSLNLSVNFTIRSLSKLTIRSDYLMFWRADIAIILVWIGCGWAPVRSAEISSTNFPVALKADGIDNFFKLSDRIYSGAAPEGD